MMLIIILITAYIALRTGDRDQVVLLIILVMEFTAVWQRDVRDQAFGGLGSPILLFTGGISL